MTSRVEKEALRAAGYVRVPTLWVLPDELEVIYKIASKHNRDVKRIRDKARHDRAGNATNRTWS